MIKMVGSVEAFHTYVAPEHLPTRLKGTDRYVFDSERDLTWPLPRCNERDLTWPLPRCNERDLTWPLPRCNERDLTWPVPRPPPLAPAPAIPPPLAPAPAIPPPLAPAPAIPPPLAPALPLAAALEGAASVRPPATAPDGHAAALAEAARCNERLDWSGARAALAPWTHQHDARTLIERTICNLQLAEDAVEAKPPDGISAKERAAEALETARLALETAPEDAAAHIWYGQAVGTHAKVFDPGLGQGRVCNVLVQHWDRAVELAPQDPLPYHLLGSFAFHTSALPWATQSIVRALSPGLRKFTADDAMELLRQSEARMPSPPCHFAVTNRSMLGRLHLRKGQKVEARVWLDKALELLAPGTALDRSGQEAADEARKARAKL